MLFCLSRGHVLHLQAEGDVVLDRQPVEQRVILEDHAAFPARLADRLAVEQQFALGRLLEAGDHREQRGLAAAGVAEHRAEFVVIDREIHAAQRHAPEDRRRCAREILALSRLADRVAIGTRRLPTPRPTTDATRASAAGRSNADACDR